MDGVLYQAAKNGHEAVVQLLLKHMVDVDARMMDKWCCTGRLRMGTRQ
jgi:hypothetical protein